MAASSTFVSAVAGDVASAALNFYIKGPAFAQTIQDRPLLRTLEANKKTFSGGVGAIKGNVRGSYLDSDTDFFAGYTEDEALLFDPSDGLVQFSYNWYELHAGLVITWSELKKDGISIVDGKDSTSKHSGADAHRITPLLEDRLADFGESWAREMNAMLWKDGSQDSEAVPGILSILTDTAAVGTTGNINRATYDWWRHRVDLALAPSAANQTMTKALRSEARQLRRYGGRPTIALCGSDFIEALELEVHEKGYYTDMGFINKGKTDVGMADISLRGMGTFQYDPTLDDLGLTKRCYIIDPKTIVLRPMEGEENKLVSPERPYNYAVFLKSMFWTGGLICKQLNANGVYAIA